MDCITNVEIPQPLTEKCSGIYYSTDCISIPEDNVILDLPEGASQTEVNNALTAALIYKEQQITELQNTAGAGAIIIDGENTVVIGSGADANPYIINLNFDITDYQLKNIPDDVGIASVLNEGRLRYRTDSNNSYVDMCMKVGVGLYNWINILTNNWA